MKKIECEYKEADGSCSHPSKNRSCGDVCIPMTEETRSKLEHQSNIAIDPYLKGVIENEAKKEKQHGRT